MPREKRKIFMVDNYFPSLSLIFGLTGLIGASALFFYKDFSNGLFMVIPSVLILPTKKGISINLSRKEIKKYIRIVGIPFVLNAVKYNSVDKVNVKKVRISQRLNSRGSSTILRYDLYKSFLITEGQAYLLSESKNREYVLKKMEILAKALNTSLVVE
jgi:hypothetical protein